MNSKKRILELFVALLSGKMLTKTELMQQYKKDGSTIQRDMTLIEEVIDEHQNDAITLGKLNRETKGAYCLPGFFSENFLTDDELTAVLKILLSSRALSKPEMEHLCEKITNQATDQERLKKAIANEQRYYRGVPTADKHMIERLHLIFEAIRNNCMIEFTYTKLGQTLTFQRIPTAVFFSDLYFYMATSSHTAQDDSDFEQLNKFRINNLENIRILSSHNQSDYAKRFEAGIFHGQTALYPFLGSPIHMIVDYYHEPAYVLDRFPNSKIADTPNEDGSIRIDIDCNDGYGVKMWLLGQGDMIKVISPRRMKDYLLEQTQKMLAYYGYHIEKNQD